MKKKTLLSFILALTVAVGAIGTPLSVMAAGEKESPENMPLHVNGKTYICKTLNVTYDNNAYVSIRDIAYALSGSDKQFDVSVGNEVRIETGVPYVGRGCENTSFDEEVMEPDFNYKFNLKTTPMFIDNREIKRYILVGSVFDGVYDCFISVPDLAITLDCDMKIENDELYIETGKEFKVDPEALMDDEFFMATKSCLLGDVTTGKIIYEYDGDETVLIASTSKLMTYLLVMDAVSEGKIGMNDEVIISREVSKLSYGEDGVIELEEGLETNVPELLKGMLLASSNECAKALAEHVAGSEEAFVKMMNDKAKSLGLSESTRFYNSNGLPTYTDEAVASKRQNRSTAEDMYKLVKYILAVYPQVTDITSLKEASLPSMEFVAKNTNPLLYNVDGAVGLKTGTTNGAMCCLITAKKVDCSDGEHMLVSLVFGSESYVIRGLTSELLLDYGTDYLRDNVTETSKDSTVPTNAEDLVKNVIKVAEKINKE